MTRDVCCWVCRTPFGCAIPKCPHHLEARRTQDADDRARQTVRRPTEDRAIKNVMREQRKGRRKT